MQSNLLSILRCPACGGVLSDASALQRGGSTPSGMLESGVLQCSCHAEYPVIDGVPRLLEPALAPADSQQKVDFARNGDSDPFTYIRESFSREWRLFDYESDKTWGWTLEERKRIFLDDIGMSKKQVEGKVLLDAGCGNGTLTAAVASFNMSVVGTDLNDGLGNARHCAHRFAGKHSDKVEYVQANLASPPFAPASFDIIYCSGVLHHTPDTRQSFKRLVPLIKPGGRMYIWVYGTRNVIVRTFADSGRSLKKVLSPQGLLQTCKIIAPFYKAGTDALNACGISEFRKRTSREVTLDLFDAFAPEFNHRHTEQEVQRWFEECGFINITPSGRQKHGLGMYGDIPL